MAEDAGVAPVPGGLRQPVDGDLSLHCLLQFCLFGLATEVIRKHSPSSALACPRLLSHILSGRTVCH